MNQTRLRKKSMHSLYHLYQQMSPLKPFSLSSTKDHSHRSHERLSRLTGHPDNLLPQQTEGQPGSDITLSESAGRVLPGDRESGVQSEDLRNCGVAHAILCFQILQIPPCRLPASDESHVTMLPISSSEREVTQVRVVVVSLYKAAINSFCDEEWAVDGPGSLGRTAGV
jgi:hypothetical protein